MRISVTSKVMSGAFVAYPRHDATIFPPGAFPATTISSSSAPTTDATSLFLRHVLIVATKLLPVITYEPL